MEARVTQGPYRSPGARDDAAPRRLQAHGRRIARRFAARRRREAVVRAATRAAPRVVGLVALASCLGAIGAALLGEPAPWVGPSALVTVIGGGMAAVFSLARAR